MLSQRPGNNLPDRQIARSLVSIEAFQDSGLSHEAADKRLRYGYGQVHAGMDAAIVVVGARGIKRANIKRLAI